VRIVLWGVVGDYMIWKSVDVPGALGPQGVAATSDIAHYELHRDTGVDGFDYAWAQMQLQVYTIVAWEIVIE
jgi:hypothetical protein